MAKTNKGRKFFATTATAALVASAIVPVASAAQVNDFNSIASYAQEAVQDLVDRGVVQGDANGNFQPRKSVSRAEAAEVLTKALNLISSGDVYFTDVKSGAWYYDSINAAVNNGVFQGKGAGIFEPNGNLTRGEAAVILVNAFGLEKTASLAQFADEKTVKPWAVEALEIAVGNGVILGDNGKIKANDAITKQDFAVMFARAELASEGGKEDQEASSVLPTAVSFVETSIQGEYGEKVTLQAKLTVEAGESAANIPVKFDVFTDTTVANDTTIVPQLTETVQTDENGVATYTYTRAQGSTDSVNAYATGKPGLKASAKVYWNSVLTIKDITEGTTLANGEQKVYQVNGKRNETVYVAFKENLNVAPEKAVRGVEFLGLVTTGDTASAKFAYEYTTGGFAVGVLKLDDTGKANLVLTGDDASATPIAFVNNPGTDAKFDATALQAVGSEVTFAKESVFNLSIAAEGNQTAAVWKNDEQTGGRDYVATLKNQEGKALANAELLVTFDSDTTTARGEVKVYDVDGEFVAPTTGDSVTFRIVTDKDGIAKFTVAHPDADAYATPIVFIDNGTGNGSEQGKLDKKDLQVTGEIAYFRATKASDYRSALVITNEEDKEVKTFGSDTVAEFAYQLSDQNGKARSYDTATPVQFTVRAGAQPVALVNANGTPVTETVNGVTTDVVIPAYTSKTLTPNSVVDTNETKTSIYLKSNGSDVRVTATPTNSGLAGLTSVTDTVTFLSGASTSYFTVSDVTQTGTSKDAAAITLTFNEAVTSTSISVTGPGTTATTVTTDSANDKVLYVGFVTPVSVGQTVTVSYKGRNYGFNYVTENGKNVFKAN